VLWRILIYIKFKQNENVKAKEIKSIYDNIIIAEYIYIYIYIYIILIEHYARCDSFDKSLVDTINFIYMDYIWIMYQKTAGNISAKANQNSAIFIES